MGFKTVLQTRPKIVILQSKALIELDFALHSLFHVRKLDTKVPYASLKTGHCLLELPDSLQECLSELFLTQPSILEPHSQEFYTASAKSDTNESFNPARDVVEIDGCHVYSPTC